MPDTQPKTPYVDRLRQKRDQLNNRIKDLEARKQLQERKDDTRRKIIAGALALEHAEKNPDSAFTKKILGLLDEYVIRPRERALFGLPPIPAEPANDKASDPESRTAGLKTEFPG